MKNLQQKLNSFNQAELNYLKNLIKRSKHPYLTNLQIVSLIKKYRDTKDLSLMQEIIDNYIKLIINRAKKYKCQSIDIGDLVHYGIEGIMEAVEKSFDLSVKEKFITYITIIIERRMKDGSDIQRGAVMLPKNIMTDQRKLRMMDTNSDTVYTKLSVGDLTNLKNLTKFEYPEIIDTYIDVKLKYESLEFDIFRILNNLLTPIEKIVIIHSFGLNGESVKAFDAIGTILDISLQKVRKIKNEAINKIKNNNQSITILNKYFN